MVNKKEKYKYQIKDLKNGNSECLVCGKIKNNIGIYAHIWRTHTEEGIKHNLSGYTGHKGRIPWNKGLTKYTDIRVKKISENHVVSPNSGNKKGSIPWNKGLTKYTDERVLKGTNKFKERYARGEIKNWSEGLTKENSKSLRISSEKNKISMKGNLNWINSLGKTGAGKKGNYKGYYFDSSWEFYWIVWALDNKINFRRNTQKFSYYFKGRKCFYIPDFKINSGNFIEIKGWYTEEVFEKIKQFKYKLEIIDKDRIDFYKCYVETEYGKNYISQFFHNNFSKKERKTRKEYYVYIKEKYENKQKYFIELIQNSNIDFSKLGWVTKVSKITKIRQQHVSEWMKRFMKDFYNEKCFKRKNSL